MLQTLDRPSVAVELLRLCRPKHWTKNVFVLAGLVFSESFLSPHMIAAALIALACFCLWSSAIYVLNDVVDAEADRQHPGKCLRPIASGAIAPAPALVVGVLLAALGVAIAWYFLTPRFLLIGGLYLANSIAYCFVTKSRVIADVMAIAIGFVLRLMAGCAAVGVEPTNWLLVCGFSLAVTLGFGKRRVEVGQLGSNPESRASLISYSERSPNEAVQPRDRGGGEALITGRVV